MQRIPAELIINGASRRARETQRHILSVLDAAGFDITVNLIQPGVTIKELLDEIKRRKPQLVIAGGGDGTISDVADHLVGLDIELGIIPLGTTNNFARSVNVPLDITAAIETIRSQSARPVDLGKINGDYFTNVAGIGLSAEVAYHVTDTFKRRWGRLAYALVGLRLLVTHKPFMVTLADKDNELQLKFETHQVIIANGRYHAGKEIAADAKIDNRELVIFALGGGSRLSLLKHTLDFYIGTRQDVAHSSYLVGKNIRLQTSTPQRVELDGEVKFQTPLTAEVAPRALLLRYKP